MPLIAFVITLIDHFGNILVLLRKRDGVQFVLYQHGLCHVQKKNYIFVEIDF